MYDRDLLRRTLRRHWAFSLDRNPKDVGSVILSLFPEVKEYKIHCKNFVYRISVKYNNNKEDDFKMFYPWEIFLYFIGLG